MPVKIYSGVLNRTSNGTKYEYATKYDFIEIGGERLMKVAVSNLMDNFLTVGQEVAISVYKERGANHNICAIRELNGRITKTPLTSIIGDFVMMLFAVALLSALAIFASLFIFEPTSAKYPVMTWVIITTVLPFLIVRGEYKARNGLDSYQPKANN